MKVGEKIRIRREELGLTQLDLAKKLGYKDRSTIAYIEKDGGRLSLPKLEEFAKALLVTPEYLMGWDVADEINSSGENYIVEFQDTAEMELLRLFNSLSDEGKEVAISVLRGLSTQYKKSDSINKEA